MAGLESLLWDPIGRLLRRSVGQLALILACYKVFAVSHLAIICTNFLDLSLAIMLHKAGHVLKTALLSLLSHQSRDCGESECTSRGTRRFATLEFAPQIRCKDEVQGKKFDRAKEGIAIVREGLINHPCRWAAGQTGLSNIFVDCFLSEDAWLGLISPRPFIPTARTTSRAICESNNKLRG
jgi:hypothetical protein